MSAQAPGKSSAKRRGKQISFFTENTRATQPSPNRQRKNGMLQGEVRVSEGMVEPQQPPKPTAPITGVHCHPVAGVNVEMDQENVTKDGTVPPNWTASILVDHLPPKGGLNWQPAGHGVSWNQSAAPFCSSSGASSSAPGPFQNTVAKQGSSTHLLHESLQSQQDNKGTGSQLGLFADAIKQMDEKAHLAKRLAKQPVHLFTELPKPQLQNLQHQIQQNLLQHHRQQQSQQNQLQQQSQQNQLQQQSQQNQLQQQSQQNQLQQQSQQNQLQQQSQQNQLQQQSQQNQLQHQNQLLHESQQNNQLQHQHQTTKAHAQMQLPSQQAQLQHQHQQQIRLQHQHQQNQRQYKQTQLQNQQAQLLHHQEFQQPQTSNETLIHHQFFQFPYGQCQKPDLPPNSVLNMFHRQPSLLPLYSRPSQAACQQHLFQQFFPHQQPPQSLGLHRIQTSQGPDPPTHLMVSAPSQLQQASDTQISKDVQRSTGGHKLEHPLCRVETEFQTPLAKQTRCALNERKVKPCLFELHRLGNERSSRESTSQYWPQAYGPELQKLLNMPSNRGAQNQHKLYGVDLVQPKDIQAHSQTNEDIRSERGHEKIQVNQSSQKSAQETSSEIEESTESVIQAARKGGGTSNEASGLQPQQVLSDQNSSTETQENGPEEERKGTLEHSKDTGTLAEAAPAVDRLDDSCLMPLVIPVSVPVRNINQKGGEESQSDLSERNPSALTTRKRRLSRGSGPSMQEVEHSRSQMNLTAKLKRRPRPEPLFIPPKPHNHVSVIAYPPGTLYQSNLRSPVRLPEHPVDRNFQPPPYTPPPILSPMREGSGLYFNAILSASTSSSQPVTPRSTPKFCLSRSNSADTPPPVLPLMNEATPASIEPRINIGPQFQAEIPELRDKSLAVLDANHADLVFKPWESRKNHQLDQQRMEDLMTVACSSILPGGGTNQELTLHCLHEAKGNILAALNMLLLRKSPRGRSRALINYHYAGSDKWTSREKAMFNKGLTAHKKDFFLVQKLVKTKTVAQCVEFYYTYKKQVKIGKNGTLIFGDMSTTDSKTVDESSTIDRKVSLRRKARIPLAEDFKNELSEEEKEDELEEEEEDEEEEEIEEDKEEYRPDHKKVILNQQAQNVHLRKSHNPAYRQRQPAALRRNERAQLGDSTKLGKQTQENIFPCKKCGKVFYKVKSRSAHMKSHSVQEKKQREVELKLQAPAVDEQAKDDEECSDYSLYCQDG
ncbi:mitotic deacetylase-associated SANT domain protein isoform X1 [Hypanus sabinus]|uniref:mitotic deacetylase-associated SANT domain protein isoform X1 n=1 Tax=Hypanus sabinus TaxID=79690 RepID=UPI0028C44A7F|nr:mitotic deacetylase-associated SANT domain protein isoform X1 [Hypanus sabinus]XP_059807987.1 mitotic deacetylase-associated SANT domain protein isoform X1 [Hypanus sabinus]XP_059807994.1 mitotic deacetylase-associated SANT domain protein isoform X1 [Hypanus sabinus]XP_059808001.1 mitotic deacetylase-associated SANT domain protein isoform X1 [Hypanus sabinus]XP_059808009.1 mitotic deacetylase-associated SANT domain protein isoform X1 [Hypanus sabinus]